MSERTVGNWERGSHLDARAEARLRGVLPGLDDGTATAPRLPTASDAELLAEIARRFARARDEQGSEPAMLRAARGEYEEENPVK